MTQPRSAQSSVLRQLDSQEFDWMDSIGGWRGLVETTLPLLLFLFVYRFTLDLWWAAGGALAISIGFVLIRLLTRITVVPALSGVFGVLISIVWALWSGKGENYFAFGLITTAAFALILLVSILIRQPAAAYGVQMVWELPANWMRNPDYASLYRRCLQVTYLWCGLFALRSAVQIPLWWGAQVEALATAKLVMGLPLVAVVAWLTWMSLRPFAPATKPQASA